MMYQFKLTLPSPPFIDVEGIANFRDIGGYPIPPSDSHGPLRSVRRGLIFRSAEPTRVTAAGMHKLQSLGVTTIFDLRSAAEAMKDVKVIMERDGSQLERVSVPIFAEDESDDGKGMGKGGRKKERRDSVWQNGGEGEDEGDENEGKEQRPVVKKTLPASYKRCAQHMQSGVEGFTNAYREIVYHAGASLRTILNHILASPSDPIILHCSLGRDRTGVIIGIILSLLGVPDAIIAKEYQLTEVGLGPMREEIVADVLGRERERGTELGEKAMSRMKKVECLVGAREENMLSMLDMLRREYGGVEGYVREKCGFEGWEIERVKGALVVGVAPIHYSSTGLPE